MKPPELLYSGRVTLTRAETARILGIDARTVSAAISRGEIAAVTYGARVLVLAEPLRAQLALPPGKSEDRPRSRSVATASPDTTGAADHDDTRGHCCRCSHDPRRQEAAAARRP